MAKVSLRAYNREIETLVDHGHLDEAIGHCRHILKTFPKHLETYRLLGKAYLEYKRYNEAVDIFSRVLASVPNDFVAHVGMSIIRDEENKLDDAIWHMERAFETQPSNSAIQSELQRLYGRRDGVQPPRIRMTRGALAHMYVQGELYPQAISEIKSVLKEDPGRSDMQALLARACYKSGLKNEAAEVASALLHTYPYCLDANRVLVEILGADHPENAQVYHRRVVELDPYAAHVTGTIFLSNEVSDAAVSLEHFEWNGQAVGMQPDWAETQAIGLEGSRAQDAEPDWLKGAYPETTAPPFPQETPTPAFDMSPAKPAEPAEDIPDFLRAAGWGQSTGAFDESKPVFAEQESTPPAQPIEQGELPDWVKAMAPVEAMQPPAEEEEELPDWINKIGTGALPVSSTSESSEQPDWMNQFNQPSSQPSEDQPDWLKQFSQSEQPAPAEEQPDWLKGFGLESESTPSAAPTEQSDWLSELSGQPESTTLESSSTEFDFLTQPLGESETASSVPSSNEFDFLNQSNQPETTPATPSSEEFDFLNELTEESQQLAPSSSPEPSMKDINNLGVSEQERDDSFAWLENLAAKQGATEGLLTKPEERLQEEPDWVKQAKGMNVTQPPAEQPPVAQPTGNLEELGKSEQERDDSFAWLENLAAKQGASEGLLTKPEERLDEEPDWIKQAKSLGGQAQRIPITPPPQVEEPSISESLEEPTMNEQKRDESLAWSESSVMMQSTIEDVLTTPEERSEQEPDWMKQGEDVEAEQPAVAEGSSSIDDTAAWLRSLDEQESLSTPAPTNDDTAMWLKSLDRIEVPSEPVQSPQAENLPAWMQNIEEEKPAEASISDIPASDLAAAAHEEETVEVSEWMRSIEEPAADESPTPQGEDLPSWLNELDQEEEQASTPTEADQDLPAWMRGVEEAEREPLELEPMRATDWQPVETEQPEQIPAEPAMQEDQPESLEAVQEIPLASAPAIEEPEPTPAADWQPPETEQPEEIPVQPMAQEPQPEPLEVAEEMAEPVALASEMKEPEPEFSTVAQEKPEIEVPAPETEEPVAPTPEFMPAPESYQEPAPRETTEMPLDPVLGQARTELSGNNIAGALENYARLIKKGRFLDEVIHDLRDTLYRYPVDVDIWQSLGDAYMRANRLQDALDAYTKAEELLR